MFLFVYIKVILLLKNQLGVHRQRKMSRSDTARSLMYFQLSNNNNASRPRLSICSHVVKTNDETGVKLVTETGVKLVTDTKPDEVRKYIHMNYVSNFACLINSKK